MSPFLPENMSNKVQIFPSVKIAKDCNHSLLVLEDPLIPSLIFFK